MNLHSLSSSQLQIWIGQQLYPDVPLYNEAVTFTFAGHVDTDLFTMAFQTVVDKSDALRTVFTQKGETAQSYVLPSMPNAIGLLDLSDDPAAAQTAHEWMTERCKRHFDLERKLFDAVLIRLSAEKSIWYLCQHHLITDMSSVQLTYELTAHCYALAQSGQLDDVTAPPQFADYLSFEQESLDTPRNQKAQTFWQNRQKHRFVPTDFYGKTATNNQPNAQRIIYELGAERSQQIFALAQTSGIRLLTADLTLFTIFSTLLTTYLHRIHPRDHISLGALFANRQKPQFKKTQGMFIRGLPITSVVEPEETFLSLYKKVVKEQFDLLRHIDTFPAEQTKSRAFDAVLNYLPNQFGDFAGIPCRFGWMHTGYGDDAHAFRLQVHDFDATGELILYFDVNLDVFDEHSQEWLVAHFLKLLDAFLEDPDQHIDRVNLLTEHERTSYLGTFNGTEAIYPSDQTVIQLFERQAQMTPSAIAIVTEPTAATQQTLTYAQLAERVSHLANHLHQRGIGRNTIVGICLNRSIDAVIAILATLKAGATYMPLDPAHPDERLLYMLSESRTPLVLTHRQFTERLHQLTDAAVLTLDDNFVDGELSAQIEPAQPNDTAYILYTSGSTGKPKGVMVTQRGLTNYAWWAQKQYCAGERLTFPLFSPLTFDLTVTSIFVPLVSGGSIVVYGADEEGVPNVLRVCSDNAVDIIKLTPAHLSLLVELGANNLAQLPTRVKRMIVGGEDFKTSLARNVHDLFGGEITLFNEYGPTETVVGCMVHPFDPERDTLSSVPIGRPVANAQIYLLDGNDQPVPTGVIGQIHIGGAGVAHGYLNRPELTAERFIQHEQFGRLYRSGDLGRWGDDGQLAFLGRADHQVKLNGYRIELGEIESQLLAHPSIQEAVVVPYTPAQTNTDTPSYCVYCGLPTNYPSSTFDDDGVCHMCRQYETYQDRVANYFKSPADLRTLITHIKSNHQSQYDAIVLVSGGKDSTYMLYKLVEMGLNPLVFSMDNGYISESAKENVRTVTHALDVDLHWGQTPHMNAIFADSLARHSNVCHGCFKTIYTLSMLLARQLGIRAVFTGLSRGQLFETRLATLFDINIDDETEIDANIMVARKASYRMDDAVAQHLDVSPFRDETIFGNVQIFDFYRYVDVGLDEVMAFLRDNSPWERPPDTGRSTNCLINDVGIYVHKKERGYHNYALPYSWDVRLGHKVREAALDELDDDIDEAHVQRILDEVGYRPKTPAPTTPSKQLIAYIVGNADTERLRSFLSESLPDYMLPAQFVPLQNMPLTTNGKIDREALPPPDQLAKDGMGHGTAANDDEAILTQIWQDVFRIDGIGTHDNFFRLGGDSIIAIRIVTRASQAGLHLTPRQLFEHPTIAELAAVAEQRITIQAEQGLVTGPLPLTPIQAWFFAQQPTNLNHWNQFVWLDVSADINTQTLKQAIDAVMMHHDCLRLIYSKQDEQWQQSIRKSAAVQINIVEMDDEADIKADAIRWQDTLDIEAGDLIRAVLYRAANRLLLIIHHLAVDALSWPPLLEDIETAYRQIEQGKTVQFPAKTTSYQQWATAVETYAAEMPNPFTSDEIVQGNSDDLGTYAATETVHVQLAAATTASLLQDANNAYNTQINELLLTTLARSWQKPMRVEVEGHGRDSHLVSTADHQFDLSRTVGWFTILTPFQLVLKTTEIAEQIKGVKEYMRSISKRDIDYGAWTVANGVEQMPQADVLFNYLGQVEQTTPSGSLLQQRGRLHGSFGSENKRTHPIELVLYVEQDRLHVELHYSDNLFDRQEVERIARRFIDELTHVVEHCLDPTAGSVTASDFDLAGLDQTGLSQLGNVLDALGDK